MHQLCPLTAILLLILATSTLLAVAAMRTALSPAEDPTVISREAFAQLAQVYKSGGTAPDLLARLNSGLELIQEAHVKRINGEESQAVELEEKARTIITGVMNDIPAAQQRAQGDATTKLFLVAASVPVVVVLSTLVFYAILRTWRWYEKTKLFEMEIVEKKKEED